MLGAQESPQHGIGRDADSPQGGSLELSSEIKHLDFQIFNLQVEERRGRSSHVWLAQKAPVQRRNLCQH